MGRSGLEEERRRLLDHIRERLGDVRVLRAMEQVERSDFVPASSGDLAYEDIALPIGEGQDDLPAVHRGPHGGRAGTEDD